MNLNFSDEELQFQGEVRQFLAEKLTKAYYRRHCE